MTRMDLLLAAPEIWILVMACAVMITDLFLDDSRRGIVYTLVLITLIFAGILTARDDYLAGGLGQVMAFGDTFVRDRIGETMLARF